MRDAGLEASEDALGNLTGRRGSDRIMIGSHLDSVADAGRYDGILGILVGLEVAAATDVPLEVVAFADEEGLRFGSTFLGSRVFIGRVDDPAVPASGPPLFDGARAYLEVHIEQGPVLEAEGLPLGVVTAINGQSRFDVVFEGRAGHAGTTPMELRHDALAAAAEFVLAAERAGGTVGVLAVPHCAANVIPGRVEATLDIRDPDDAARARRIAALRAEVAASGARRGVAVRWSPVGETPATPCSPRLVSALERAVAETGVPVRKLPSGAGHDAMSMAAVTEIAMLFVRCAGGIRHQPDEAVLEDDVALAIDAATRFACSI
jgi:allantoate deiminase